MSEGIWRHDPFRKEIVTLIGETFVDLCREWGVEHALDANQVAALLTIPPDFNLGQAAFPCFSFAKALRKGPPVIAQELATRIAQKNRTTVSKVDAVQGYLNFHQASAAVGSALFDRISSSAFFINEKIPSTNKEKVVIE